MTSNPEDVYPSGGVQYRNKKIQMMIDTIARTKAAQAHHIAYLDIEDLAQEIRFKCYSVLKQYDPTRTDANLHTFLSVCADNRLRDLRRSVLYKHCKPCKRCSFGNKRTRGCVKYADKHNCDRYAKHERYISSKLSASRPIEIGRTIYKNRFDGLYRSSLTTIYAIVMAQGNSKQL
jgi:hypothetical protein